MKKVLVLLALVAVGALVFAEDAPAPTYEFSANATGGWTYNLDTEQSTFINDWDLSLKYHLLNDVKKTKGADEGTYGYIEVTHINLNIFEETESTVGDDSSKWGDGSNDGDDDNLSITAKIVSGPIEVGLYGAPGNNYENAKYVPLFDSDAGYTSAVFGVLATATSDSAFKPQLTRAKGLSLKYTFGDFGYVQVLAANTAAAVAAAATTTYAVYVATGTETSGTYVDFTGATIVVTAAGDLTAGVVYSKVTTTAAVAAADPQYLIGANIQVKPVASDALTVQINGGFQTNLETSDMMMTAKAAVTAGVLSVSGAFDGSKAGATGGVFQWDAAFNVAYSLFEKKDSVNLDFYSLQLTDDSDTITTDLGIKYVDAEGLVPGLGFTVGFFWFDLLDNWEYDPKTISFAESLNYKYALSDTTYVKPYQALRYDLDDIGQSTFGVDNLNDAIMYLNFGVEAQLFPNCILTADFYKGNKCKDNNENLVKAGG